MFTNLWKNTIKDTDEQPGEEITLGEIRDGPKQRSFFPVELGFDTLPVMCSGLEVLWTPYCWDFYGGFFT